MIKSKFGPITNPKTGMSKDIVINALSKESLKDILIGGGIVMVGITYHKDGRGVLVYTS